MGYGHGFDRTGQSGRCRSRFRAGDAMAPPFASDNCTVLHSHQVAIQFLSYGDKFWNWSLGSGPVHIELTLAVKPACLLPSIVRIPYGYQVHRTLGISYTTGREISKHLVYSAFGAGFRYALPGLRAGGAGAAAPTWAVGRSLSTHGRLQSPTAVSSWLYS